MEILRLDEPSATVQDELRSNPDRVEVLVLVPALPVLPGLVSVAVHVDLADAFVVGVDVHVDSIAPRSIGDLSAPDDEQQAYEAFERRC